MKKLLVVFHFKFYFIEQKGKNTFVQVIPEKTIQKAVLNGK